MSGAIGESRIRVLAVAGLLCAAAAVCSGGERILTHSEYQMKKLSEKVAAERSGQIAEAEKIFEQGRVAWADGNFAVAKAQMETALNKIGAIPGNDALNRYADLLSEYNDVCVAFGQKRFAGARQKFDKGDYPGALGDTADVLLAYRSALALAYITRNGAKMLAIPGDLYESWLKGDTKMAADLDALSRACQGRMKANATAREVALPQFDEKYSENQKEIEVLRRKATTFIQEKKYVAAVDALEKIYLIDPFDVYATSTLKRIYNKMYTAGIARRDADLQGLMSAFMWRWIEPISSGVDSETASEVAAKSVSADMFAKLDRIILPSLEFDESDISAVVKHLNQRSRTYDPLHEGVNFSIAMTRAESRLLNKVSLRFSNIPLSEALRYICQDLGLKYRVDDDGVTIGRDVDDMQTRTFSIRADLISKIADEAGAPAEESEEAMGGGAEGGAAGSADPGAGGGDGSGEGSGTLGAAGEGKDYSSEGISHARGRKTTVSSAQLKAAFVSWGISFGRGSAVSYDPRTSRLRITNTGENLLRLGKLLRQMDAVETPLVLVEVKLLEVTEDDLQELGFEWAFSMNNMKSGKNSTDPNVWTASTGNPLRNSSVMKGDESGSGGPALVKNLKLLPNFGNGLIDGVNMDLSLTINAVSQNSRVETLSAPKLITSNGNEATIKLSRSYYFPDDWEEPELETSGNFTSVTQPIPEWGDAGTDVGIIMTVRPQVDPNNSDITLELEPRVVTYIGNSDDTVKIAGGYINFEDNMRQYIETWGQTYNVWMPILGERYLKTTVKIKDGETLVLGGMVDNKMETLYDRWPVLGDIPLIGRLFSSQYERQSNSNLLVFVTARLVNNSGLPFEQNVHPDIPDFRR